MRQLSGPNGTMFPLSDNAHDSLFSPAALRLAEIHWYLLKAAIQMRRRTTKEVAVEGSMFVKYEDTEFGHEVGRDEINWWVFKRETDLVELRVKSERALQAAQALKEAAGRLKGRRWSSYDDGLATVRETIEAHSTQIDEVHAYVRWLHERDTLAPSILFAYRVWGSTRRSDRWFQVGCETPTAEEPGTIRTLAEIALGLRKGMGLYVYDWAWAGIKDDMWNALADAAQEHKIEVPVDQVVSRAGWEIINELTTYFEEIRDSLRNILLDIDKCMEQRNLLWSDPFWRRFVAKAAGTEKSELQLWDFKETLTMWKVSGDQKELAKVTFTEDIASFANARGGILIVGVTDGRPREIVGIGVDRDVENRLKSASEVVWRHVEYPRDIVTFRQVVIADKNGTNRTCLVVVIAQACEAVGVRGQRGQYTYPVRQETGIDRVSRLDLIGRKSHMKSDNHDFFRELAQFVEES